MILVEDMFDGCVGVQYNLVVDRGYHVSSMKYSADVFVKEVPIVVSRSQVVRFNLIERILPE